MIPVLAQDALRSTLEGDKAYRLRTLPSPWPGDQWKVGPLTLRARVSYSLEWNDNISYVATDAEDDFIHQPQFNVHATWAATKDSTLGFGMGLGYLLYTKHSEFNRFMITPDSELAWDIPVKDFLFTLYDRFQYSQDVASQGAISGTAEFPRMENTVGARGRWQPDRYLFELGYGHYNFIADSSEFDYLSRSAELFFGRAGYRLAAATYGGVEAAGALTFYDKSWRGDNTSVSVGPFLEWQVTRALQLGLHAGYVRYAFDPSPPLQPQATTLESWYATLDLNHQLTDHITHGVTAARGVQQALNENSQYIRLLSLRYAVSWKFYKQATLTADCLFENSKEPQTEEYDRWGLGVGISYQLLRKLSAGIGYRFYDKDSDAAYDYRQHRVILNATYQF